MTSPESITDSLAEGIVEPDHRFGLLVDENLLIDGSFCIGFRYRESNESHRVEAHFSRNQDVTFVGLDGRVREFPAIEGWNPDRFFSRAFSVKAAAEVRVGDAFRILTTSAVTPTDKCVIVNVDSSDRRSVEKFREKDQYRIQRKMRLAIRQLQASQTGSTSGAETL
jgi:hypothetical protein